MGCDYYIFKYLEIEHSHGTVYCLIKRERGWFCDVSITWDDSDDEHDMTYQAHEPSDYMAAEYAKLWDDMEKLCLTPRRPRTIYEHGKYLAPYVEHKYKSTLLDKIRGTSAKLPHGLHRCHDTGTLTSLADIVKITKKEARERVH